MVMDITKDPKSTRSPVQWDGLFDEQDVTRASLQALYEDIENMFERF